MVELISVIVPAYNVEAYLSRCLDSILAQSYQAIEVVVVDDGSQDGTAGIIDQYAEKYPQRVIALHNPNRGVTYARLAGVEASHGGWIGFVDADDSIDSEMYERLMANAQKYHADVSHCGYQLVLPDEVVYYHNTRCLVQQDKQEALIALLDGSYIEPGLWNKLYNRRLFHSLLREGVMDGSIRNNEDLLMNYYLFREAERTVYEDFCPYHYILRLGSATTNQISENKLKDPIKVLRILLQETQGYSQQYEAVRRRYVRALCNIATMLTGGQTETNILYRKEMRCALRRELPEILSKKHYGIRLKAIALCAAVWPGFYAGIHWMYSRIKGLDKTRNLKRVR